MDASLGVCTLSLFWRNSGWTVFRDGFVITRVVLLCVIFSPSVLHGVLSVTECVVRCVILAHVVVGGVLPHHLVCYTVCYLSPGVLLITQCVIS